MSEERKPTSGDELRDITSFLLTEARFLDEHRYRDWLGLLTADVHYLMPGVDNRYRADPGPPERRMGLFDDRTPELLRRIERFESEAAWPEDPPTRHLHVISNIEAFTVDDGYEVLSAFVNHRSRGDHDNMLFFGRRTDLVVRAEDGLRLRRRVIHGGQSLLAARNLNTFL